MPLPSSRPVLARYRNIFAVMLLSIVLIGGLLLVSSEEPSAVSEWEGAASTVGGQDQPGQLRNPDTASAPRIVFSTEELPGRAIAGSAGSLVFDAMGDGKPALLVWSSAGILLYGNGGSPLPIARLQSFKDVRDVTAVDINNDGLVDLCVITAHGANLLVNKRGRFDNLGSAPEFEGNYVQALWLDYDHDGDPDLILLGAKPMLLRNQAKAGFVAQPKAIPFVSGIAVEGAVIRQIPDSIAFDFIVSYRDRAGVLYKDSLGGHYAVRDLPELPAGANHLRVGDFTSDGAQDFAYLLGRSATLVGNRRGSWSIRKTVPAENGFLFADFANLAEQDWLVDGLLLARDQSNFSQSREMPTASARIALVAADFNLDGKLDFAGVATDGSVLRYINQTDTLNHWLRISLKSGKTPKTVRGTVVEVNAEELYQSFVYQTSPLQIGMRSSQKADNIRLRWPDGLIQNVMNQDTDREYIYQEVPPTPDAGNAEAFPHD